MDGSSKYMDFFLRDVWVLVGTVSNLGSGEMEEWLHSKPFYLFLTNLFS